MAKRTLNTFEETHHDLVQEVIRSHQETIDQVQRVSRRNETIQNLTHQREVQRASHNKLNTAYHVMQADLILAREENNVLKTSNKELADKLQKQTEIAENEATTSRQLQANLEDMTDRFQEEEAQHQRCHQLRLRLEERIEQQDIEEEVDPVEDNSEGNIQDD